MVQRVPRRQEPGVLQVFIFKEGRFWGTECFSQPTLTIGRSPESDLQIDDDITSRTHAQISVTPEGVILEDLGSSNGTFVNGEPVERCYLENRDEVSIGDYTLKVKLLSKKKPVPRFHDETRIMDRDVIKDDRTEIVQPEQVDADMLVDDNEMNEPVESTYVVRPQREPAPPVREVEADRQGEIAAALREELHGGAGFDAPATERLSHPPRQPDEYFVKTQVEQAPEPAAEPAGHGVRWLTPQPDESPSLQLADELEPDAPESWAPVPEPAPLRSPPLNEPSVQVSDQLMQLEGPEPALGTPLGAAVELEAGFEAGDEDEEEELLRDFVEPFSLLNNLIRENFATPQVPTESNPVIEIIGYSQEKQVMSYEQIARGKRFRIGPKRFVLARYKNQAACDVMFTDDYSGGVITGGRTVSVDELKTSTNRVGARKGQNIYAYKLMKGDYANLIHDGGGSFLRFVNPPKLPPAPRGKKFDPLSMKIFGSAFLAHILFIVILSFFSNPVEAGDQGDIDRFAKVDIKDLQAEIPQQEAEVPLDQLPEPDKVEEEKPEKEEKKEEPKKEEKKKAKKTKRRSKKKGDGGDAGSGAGAGMMAALGNLNKKKSSQNIVAAVSNLDAVRVPGGRSRYKVSGLVTKLPTSSVVLSRGRGVGVKAGIDLLRGGKGRGGRAGIGPGALGGGSIGRRKVGGVVFKAPKRKMRVRGHLSREEIAKVVRQHLREIQYCYERNLLLSPNLQGKVVMEWTIATSGSVSVVKTKNNTMASPAVAMCISAKIKGWKFPKPKGGIVVVSYPFIFNSIGF
ncbi:MAG TPA: AgmX/PglI C-terminal domain-containing protein [Myxococcota bacterium]|nr:AgmX/PglI C-terminal domain-containing protein [Myxococcota bacterium]